MNALPYLNLAPSGRRPKVLLVDDRNAKTSDLRSRLVQFGYETVQATTAVCALEQIVRWHPDLILLEICMPGRGVESIFEELSGNSSIPILIISREAQQTVLVHYLDAGAIGYVVKSSSVAELGARVRACLRRLMMPSFTSESESSLCPV
jgi:two-component system KDP operon response regulator KdpE